MKKVERKRKSLLQTAFCRFFCRFILLGNNNKIWREEENKRKQQQRVREATQAAHQRATSSSSFPQASRLGFIFAQCV